MSYVDVEMSAEALQEDEELIEAVNEIVETAATAIYTDIKNDVSGVIIRLRYFMDSAFPFLVDWRDDPTAFGRHMQNLGLAFLLYLLAFWILSPSRKWHLDKRPHGRKKHRSSSFSSETRTFSFDRIRQNVSTFYREKLCQTQGAFGTSPRKRPTLERSRSTSSIAGMNGKITPLLGLASRQDDEEEEEEDEEEETEEEKFAKRWPAVLQTKYCELVLPPQCKRVEKPKNAPKPDTETKRATSISTATDADPKEGGLEDENPAQRLVNYMRHFLHLLVSFLRYDYVGAGYSLINWIEWWLRNRRHRQSEAASGVADDEDSTTRDGALVRELSFSDRANATNSSEVVQVFSPRGGKYKLRSKRDNFFKVNKSQSTPKTPDVGESNDSIAPMPNVSLLEKSSNREGEEKEEISISDIDHTHVSGGTNMHTPPPTPTSLHKVNNPTHPDTVYETPRLDVRDDNVDLGDPRISRLALTLRANHQKELMSIPKLKDALENYRKPVLRTKPGKANENEGNPATAQSSSRFSNVEAYGETKNTETNDQISDLEVELAESISYYFETASTQEHIKKMSVDVPVPDRNGYIVGDDFLPDPSRWKPLLVFVNSRSGPQQGELLITQLRGLLNPIQVWDLVNGGPEEILESFATSFTRLRILVCGGDGTVSWIVSTMEKMKLQRVPPIAILPLGTGNDLARIHGWGGGYNNEPLTAILEQVSESYISWLDRWEMTIENKKGKVEEVKSFFNYLGVGADAQAALQVHLLRESRPQLFFSRVVNKAWYGIFGAEDILKATCVNVRHEITLIADGVEVPLPEDSQGIILLNIDSYAGGVPLWSLGTKGESEGKSPFGSRHSSWNGGKLKRSHSLDMIKEMKEKQRANEAAAASLPFDRVDSVEDLAASLELSEEDKYTRVTACDRPSSCQDGFLDIVSIRGAFHLGQIRVGLSNAQRLCQCREATIIIKRKVSVQIDGEPWRQNVCTLRVKRKKDAAIMLHRSAEDSHGVETEVANLLDWAEHKKLIDDRVHGALMKEFSRRIESKTRQRREQSHRGGAFSLKRAIGSTGNLGPGGPSPGIMF